MAIVSGGGGGGGNTTAQVVASGKVVPVADTSGVTVDTTTYTNPITGSGKVVTLVYTAETTVFSVARSGDAFPRILLDTSGDGLYMGDGTFNPYSAGGGVAGLAGGVAEVFSGAGSALTAGVPSTTHGSICSSSAAFQVREVCLDSGSGAPAVGADVGDFYLRRDGPPHIYRCMVAGIAGAATWVAVFGNPIVSGALPTVAPVSATAFQCSATRDVFLLVPVTYNPGVATTATCKVELSPDNVTFSTLITITKPVGTVFDGSIDPVTLTVPAAWYVKLTVTNATLGTGTYY